MKSNFFFFFSKPNIDFVDLVNNIDIKQKNTQLDIKIFQIKELI